MSPSTLPMRARAIGELIEMEALLEIGFVVADDLVGHLGAAVFFLEIDGRAEDDPAVGVDPPSDQ